MKVGDRVRWRGVNRIESGVLAQSSDGELWLVDLGNGKFVIVNEKSFIQ